MKKFTASDEMCTRVVKAIEMWNEHKPNLYSYESKRTKKFVALYGAPDWMYEQIISCFVTSVQGVA